MASGEVLPGSRQSVSVQALPLTSHVTLVLFFRSHFSYLFPEGVGLDNSEMGTNSLSLISLPGGRRSENQIRGRTSAFTGQASTFEGSVPEVRLNAVARDAF